MKTEEKLIGFETAKLLKELGYINGSQEYYVYYLTDFIYDEDPEHRESYKVGDIRIYNHYYKNEKDDHDSYLLCEIPTLSQIQKWLIDVHGVAVLVDLDITLSWIWKIIPMDPAASIQEYSTSQNVWCSYSEIDICLEDGILKCLNLIKDNNGKSKF